MGFALLKGHGEWSGTARREGGTALVASMDVRDPKTLCDTSEDTRRAKQSAEPGIMRRLWSSWSSPSPHLAAVSKSIPKPGVRTPDIDVNHS